MSLRDVESTNPDGSTNNCTRCCAGNPPFEISSDFNGSNTETATWTHIPAEQTTIVGAQVSLKMTSKQLYAGSAVTGVRLGWSDFVDCVLVNSDGLPAGPFVATTSTTQLTAAEQQHLPEEGMEEVEEMGDSWLAAETDDGAPAKPPPMPKSAMSPPMGFNSWNFYHCNIDENTVKQVLDAISTNGMKEAGYSYVNIDDWCVAPFPLCSNCGTHTQPVSCLARR